MSGSLIQLGGPMPPPTEVHLTVTPSAREQLLKLRTQAHADGQGLRLYVQGGGCSGLTYGMQFDDVGEGDQVLDVGDGLKVLIDAASSPMLNGVTVDFLLSLEASGFKIKNPNAKSTCSCGKSFA